MVVAHFKNLFTEDYNGHPRAQTSTLEFPSLPPEKIHELEQPFTKEDVYTALKEMHPFKAPGPDGFQAYFFQRYWNIVEGELNGTVLRVLSGRLSPTGLNSTFIMLIPKVSNPERVQQLRPIGLCNVAYKLVTKCIVN